jgi:uncharacterized membrane protein YkvA (DUF1232 family)
MKIRRVSDLVTFLEVQGDSPETLSRKLKISNMTIRRLLRKPHDTVIPGKYHAAFDAVSSPETEMVPFLASHFTKIPDETSFDGLLIELEKAGEGVQDLEKLKRDVDTKYKDKNIGKELRDNVALVLKSIFSKDLPLKYRAICVGAILYFINPIDLIPDTIPVIGYLDDFAVLTLVATLILKGKSGEKESDQGG